ncbi:hypothetical protein ACZ75_20630 [Massilia sp. NR 4-1]|nr:hypothetical protein ACZ75_20630 [Massilia sp. NR 4-1]
MTHPVMVMGVDMGLDAIPPKIMFVLVVQIMAVGMTVLHRLVLMFMLVALGQMQPDAGRHERRRAPEHRAWLFSQHEQRDRCSDKMTYRLIHRQLRKEVILLVCSQYSEPQLTHLPLPGEGRQAVIQSFIPQLFDV